MQTEASTVNKQSRVGKRPVTLPKGVELKVEEGQVSVKGPKGQITRPLSPLVRVEQQGQEVVVSVADPQNREAISFQGTTRALLNNMIQGVTEGFRIALDFYGVGYRAELSGRMLTMALGLSHQVKYELPEVVQAKTETIDQAGTKRPRLHLESADKEQLGQVAARIRSYRPPEPYKGKGIRIVGERIREKAGKAGGKKGK